MSESFGKCRLIHEGLKRDQSQWQKMATHINCFERDVSRSHIQPFNVCVLDRHN